MERLARELAEWEERTRAEVQIWPSRLVQLSTIQVFFEALLDRQREVLDPDASIPPTGTTQDQPNDLDQPVRAIGAAFALVRAAFDQRTGQATHRELLDASDLIAADVYLTAMEQARSWGVITPDQLREPPLTYTSDDPYPGPFALLRRPIRGALPSQPSSLVDVPLPIPLVALPVEYGTAPWQIGVLYHEIAHVLIADLDLGTSLRRLLETDLSRADVPPDRRSHWTTWSPEMAADAVAIVLGGSGYPRMMADFQLQFSIEDAVQIRPREVQPPPYIRLFLLAALLRSTETRSLIQVADELERAA